MKENKVIIKKIAGLDVLEGAGVKLKRVFGFHELNDFDPFLLFDHFESDKPEEYIAGFPFHPHRGIETVTYLKKGSIEHQDKLGNRAEMSPGEVQWMTTGSGIYHQEMPTSSDGINGFQLWINMPSKRKMIEPKYYYFQNLPNYEDSDQRVTIISGHYHGHNGPGTEISTCDFHYFDIEFKRESRWQYTMPQKPDSFIYVYKGDVMVDGEILDKGEGALLSHGDHIEIQGDEGSGVLFLSGLPIKEPVEWWGPIVMNTKEEIEVAKLDLHNGTFIKD